MLSLIASLIEKKRKSKNLLWRSLVFAKDCFFYSVFGRYAEYKRSIYKQKIFQYYNYQKIKGKITKIKKPSKKPKFFPGNGTLKSKKEYKKVVKEIKKIGLPLYLGSCVQKNWDSLASLSYILKNTDKSTNILDAGGVLESAILSWLSLYGYNNLTCINLIFEKPFKQGSVVYKYGDITKTDFEDSSFEAISCLSVVEHGVDIESFFKEVSRILKPGGMLVVSTDYWPTSIETKNQKAFGVPIKIFTKKNILNMIRIARTYGLFLESNVKFKAKEKVVHWKEYGLKYTFILLIFRKRN